MSIMKAVGRFFFVAILLFLIVPVYLLEKVFWIWAKLFELVMGNPRAITGTNPIGAKWVVQKTAKGASWILHKTNYYVSCGRWWLWYYSKGKIAGYFPNLYRRSQQAYSFFRGIYSFFSGP